MGNKLIQLRDATNQCWPNQSHTNHTQSKVFIKVTQTTYGSHEPHTRDTPNQRDPHTNPTQHRRLRTTSNQLTRLHLHPTASHPTRTLDDLNPRIGSIPQTHSHSTHINSKPTTNYNPNLISSDEPKIRAKPTESNKLVTHHKPELNETLNPVLSTVIWFQTPNPQALQTHTFLNQRCPTSLCAGPNQCLITNDPNQSQIPQIQRTSF